jgi:hypothetical protein
MLRTSMVATSRQTCELNGMTWVTPRECVWLIVREGGETRRAKPSQGPQLSPINLCSTQPSRQQVDDEH